MEEKSISELTVKQQLIVSIMQIMRKNTRIQQRILLSALVFQSLPFHVYSSYLRFIISISAETDNITHGSATSQ